MLKQSLFFVILLILSVFVSGGVLGSTHILGDTAIQIVVPLGGFGLLAVSVSLFFIARKRADDLRHAGRAVICVGRTAVHVVYHVGIALTMLWGLIAVIKWMWIHS